MVDERRFLFGALTKKAKANIYKKPTPPQYALYAAPFYAAAGRALPRLARKCNAGPVCSFHSANNALPRLAHKCNAGVVCLFHSTIAALPYSIHKCCAGAVCYFHSANNALPHLAHKCNAGAVCLFFLVIAALTRSIHKCCAGVVCLFLSVIAALTSLATLKQHLIWPVLTPKKQKLKSYKYNINAQTQNNKHIGMINKDLFIKSFYGGRDLKKNASAPDGYIKNMFSYLIKTR